VSEVGCWRRIEADRGRPAASIVRHVRGTRSARMLNVDAETRPGQPLTRRVGMQVVKRWDK
jgi:hypothetical protein